MNSYFDRFAASLVIIGETSLLHCHLGEPSSVGYGLLLVATIVLWVAYGGHR